MQLLLDILVKLSHTWWNIQEKISDYIQEKNNKIEIIPCVIQWNKLFSKSFTYAVKFNIAVFFSTIIICLE